MYIGDRHFPYAVKLRRYVRCQCGRDLHVEVELDWNGDPTEQAGILAAMVDPCECGQPEYNMYNVTSEDKWGELDKELYENMELISDY